MLSLKYKGLNGLRGVDFKGWGRDAGKRQPQGSGSYTEPGAPSALVLGREMEEVCSFESTESYRSGRRDIWATRLLTQRWVLDVGG
jgi:hypothetical protein